MKFQEIVTLDRAPRDGEPYMGGGCRLSTAIVWPTDAAGRPCMHLMTVPCSFFERNRSSRLISVFIPYADSSYYKEIRYLESNRTAIIIHSGASSERNEYFDNSVKSSPKAMAVVDRDQEDSEDICGSKIFNAPGWLQGEELIEGHSCKFSIYGNDFCNAFEENRGLFSDGVVHIEIAEGYEKMSDGSNVGRLVWQL